MRTYLDMERDLRQLLDDGLNQSSVMSVLAERSKQELSGASGDFVAQKARERYQSTNDDIEIASTPIFSQGADGIWVSGWVFMPNKELERPLPDRLAGKLWMVGLDKKPRQITSMDDAVQAYHKAKMGEYLVYGENERDALHVCSHYGAEEATEQDREDKQCFFSYYLLPED